MGPAAWSSPAWEAEALAWVDERLAAVGWRRTGGDQPHRRPWATVLRIPTSGGGVWMKATSPGTAFEVPLHGLLARVVPERVLVPIAADAGRGWLLLPDGGPTVGDRVEGEEQAERLVQALVRYGELQRALSPHVEELLAIGVADMRPAVLPERLEEALAAAAAPLETLASLLDRSHLGGG